jgi:hypothetical protein
MMVAALAMLYAAGIESWRLSLFRSSHGGDDPGPVAGGGDGGGGGDYERVAINIMWQSPAYILVGASEVLASVGQLEFFYDQARRLSRFGGWGVGWAVVGWDVVGWDVVGWGDWGEWMLAGGVGTRG